MIKVIKVINKRTRGNLFHYAHFICDCLFPEIVCNINKCKEVVRERSVDQTIGNFNNIYTEVLNTKNTELIKKNFDELKIKPIIYYPKEKLTHIKYFKKFRKYIFKRYEINDLEYNKNYPEVLLIKRGNRINLINDEYLKSKNSNVTTGNERREINNIDEIELFLKKKYNEKFKSLYFENMSFKNQILYFNNAKLIICAHGAVMSNMFFCKEQTKIIEVTCGSTWIFFDKISNILKLEHIKCIKNNVDEIKKCIELNTI
jgi:hypothetical protein